jgi:hypothetical protein
MTRFQMFPKIPKGILNFRTICRQKDWQAKRLVGKKIYFEPTVLLKDCGKTNSLTGLPSTW